MSHAEVSDWLHQMHGAGEGQAKVPTEGTLGRIAVQNQASTEGLGTRGRAKETEKCTKREGQAHHLLREVQ